MACDHCCYSCGPNSGEYMKMDTFKKALALSEGYVTIGGGEPTLHPRFNDILLMAVAESEECGVHIITNGKVKDRALMLAKLAKCNVIEAELSQDQYHEEISEEVVNAFEGRIRDTSRGGQKEPLPHGRGLEVLGYDENDEIPDRDYRDCPCRSILVLPNGNINPCGCDDAPTIGHVNDPPNLSYVEWSCCKESSFLDWCLENGKEP